MSPAARERLTRASPSASTRRPKTGVRHRQNRFPAPEADNSPGAELGEIISFNPDGTADGVTVELRDRDGFGRALKINPTTARVSIVELKRE